MTTVEPPADNSPRFAQLAATAFEAIYHKLAPHRAAARDEAITAWLDGHEADAVALARQVIGDVAAHPDLPDEARPIFDLLLRPEHQTQAVLTVLGIYPIVSAFVMAAVGPFVQDVSNIAWNAHPSIPLPPADAALAVLRNNIDAGFGAHEAAQSGMDQKRFDILVHNTGEPPGLLQLLELYRRGELDEAALLKGVRQSRVRDEWFDAVKALRFAPPGSLEVIAGTVKGHLPDGESRTLFEQGGINPMHYEWMLATAGRPPGAEGLMQLYNRGIIDENTFGEAIRQSDIQNRWIPELLQMRRYLPPPRTIVSMLHHGAIDDAKATELLRWHGVFPDDIALFLAEGHASRTATTKELSLSNVRAMYGDGLITRDVAVVDIVKLGYAQAEAVQIVELVDAQLVQRFRNAAVAHTHTLFVRHRIVQTDASNELDRLGIRPDVRDHLLQIWLIERELNVVPLSLAQCQGAWRRGVMSNGEFANRVRALGHPESDIPFLKALAFPATKFAHARTVADV